MKTVGIILLCRYSSSRLPGKILKEIEGKKIIEYILDRLLQVVPKPDIIIATSEEASDDPIYDFAIENGFKIFRGSLKNVANRFYMAADRENWDYIARINGDNIFIDIPTLQEMIKIAQSNDYNFISNVKNRTFPKGMSIEITKKDYYANLLGNIQNNEYHQEHVTSYLYTIPDESHFYFYNTRIPEAGGIQLALDTQEDFDTASFIINKFFEAHIFYNLPEIYSIIQNTNHEK